MSCPTTDAKRSSSAFERSSSVAWRPRAAWARSRSSSRSASCRFCSSMVRACSWRAMNTETFDRSTSGSKGLDR